ncbi:MAG TPA: aspartate kinase [Candidatus Aminicenantes bacterium]|nr:MAG: hypothetical protein C0168_07095 [Candidatus Aminicenantes bacterium]HEK85462.1 aspartate kinase [Candidatus Aminicenantes bacterium]
MSKQFLRYQAKPKITRVLKFGGSCLKDSSSIHQAALIVKEQKERVAVVVSAVQGVTDLLLDAYHRALEQGKNYQGTLHYLRQKHLIIASELLALKRFGLASEKLSGFFADLDRLLKGINLVGETSPSLKARVLSYGERLSASLMSFVLEEIGLKSRVYESDRIGLIVDRPGDEVSVNLEKFDRNFPSISKEIEGGSFIPVFTGYFGCAENGQVALFGRNGSDYSAAIIARGLKAEVLITYKDVNGFLTADPALIPQAKLIPVLSRDEAAELSYFGAKVLHPKIWDPISDRKITLEIRNYEQPKISGTIITLKSVRSEKIIKSFSINRNISVLRIEGPGVGYKPGIIGLIGSKLSEKDVNILSVLTSQTCINLILTKTSAEKAYQILIELKEPTFKKLTLEHNLALIACVGAGLRETPGVAEKIFSVLAREKINLEFFSSGASEVAIYLIVKNQDALKSIQILHRAYFEVERLERTEKPNKEASDDNFVV